MRPCMLHAYDPHVTLAYVSSITIAIAGVLLNIAEGTVKGLACHSQASSP